MTFVTQNFEHHSGAVAARVVIEILDSTGTTVLQTETTDDVGTITYDIPPGNYLYRYLGYTVPFHVAAAGGDDSRFTFVQPAPAALWTIVHNMGTKPAVTFVVDSSPDEPVFTDYDYIDDNTIQVEWPSPESGKAYLS